MDNVNKTLYIPLRGKAYVSKLGILLSDPDAEAIWCAEGFPLKGKSASKWLAYSMGIRAAVFDRWLTAQLEENPDGSAPGLRSGQPLLPGKNSESLVRCGFSGGDRGAEAVFCGKRELPHDRLRPPG